MPVVHDIFARQPRKRAHTEAHSISLHAESEQQSQQPHDCHMHDQYNHAHSHEEEEEEKDEEKQEERKHDSDECMEEEDEKDLTSNGGLIRPTQVLYINEKDLIETDDQARKRRRFEQNKLWCEAATRCAEAANKAERLRAELIAKITRQNQKLNQNSVRNAPLAADAAVAAEKARQIEVLLKDDAVGARARQERLQQAESGLLDEFAQLTIQAEKEHRIGEEAERVYSRRFIAGDRLRDAGFSKGWMRFRAVMSRLDSLGFTRSNLQKTLHLHFLQACLALIFGAEWAEVKDEVFAMLGIERVNTEVLARTARRMGKTASVAMFVVAMLESCTGIKICIFSTGQRASSALMTEIKRLLKKLPNGLERIVKETQEELRFAPAAVGKTKNEKRAAELSDDVSVLYSYPAATTTLRGCTAQIVIMEEAAFMDPGMFYEVVVPLIGVDGTAVIGITTPNSGHNYFNELIALRDQFGCPLFKVLQFGQVCSACQKTGENCKHLLDSNPAWKSYERTAKVDAIMATNPVLRDQETRGQTASLNTTLTEKQVQQFRTRARLRFMDGHPYTLFTSIDPSGGGTGSDWTVSTWACLVGGVPVLVGMEATSSLDRQEIQRMIVDHLLGAKRTYPNARFRVYIEANMSFIDANDIARVIKSTHGLMGDIAEVVKYDPKGLGRTGIWTSEASKERWKEELRRCIDTMRTVESKRFVTTQQPKHDEEDVSETHLKAFCEQLLQMRDVIKEQKDIAHSTQLFVKRGFTGKSPGKKDDRVASACIAIVHMIKDCYNNAVLQNTADRPLLACEDTEHSSAAGA